LSPKCNYKMQWYQMGLNTVELWDVILEHSIMEMILPSNKGNGNWNDVGRILGKGIQQCRKGL